MASELLSERRGHALASPNALASAARSRTVSEQLNAEREQLVPNLRHDRAGEGLRAFFEKRAPRFS